MKRAGRKPNSEEQGNRDAFRALIADIPESAFQGGTEFKRMSPGQRLEWLSQAAQFYFESGERSTRTLDGIFARSSLTKDLTEYRVNLERTLELGELSKALWIAARRGETPLQTDEERERRFWRFIIESRSTPNGGRPRQSAGEDR